MKTCPYCGTPLKETNWARKWCPNCGIIEETNNNEDNYSGYIG